MIAIRLAHHKLIGLFLRLLDTHHCVTLYLKSEIVIKYNLLVIFSPFSKRV